MILLNAGIIINFLLKKMIKDLKKNNSISVIFDKYANLFEESPKKYDFLINFFLMKITNYSNDFNFLIWE